MSTLTARRAARARRAVRLKVSNRCQCGQPMDRVGKLCQRCTDRHADVCRQKYRRTDYGSGWTAGLIGCSQALANRGMQ